MNERSERKYMFLMLRLIGCSEHCIGTLNTVHGLQSTVVYHVGYLRTVCVEGLELRTTDVMIFLIITKCPAVANSFLI